MASSLSFAEVFFSREPLPISSPKRKHYEPLNVFCICHQPNCRFNTDKNASHFCRLTWALGFSQTSAFTFVNHQQILQKENMNLPQSIKCQFVAKSWAESPFHEMENAGKLSRANIVNTISGELAAEGVLEYLLAYPNTQGAEVPFIGYERIIGAIGSLNGSFVIKHTGVFSPTAGVSGNLEIVSGSGTNDFSHIQGKGSITAKAGEHGGEYFLALVA
jgi:hypothetical protein